MHIVLGNVWYPISFRELGISPINLGIALKFKIGEIMPIPSREDIMYSKETIQTIKDKITKVFSFLQDKLNESSVDVSTLKEYTPYL